MDLPVLNTRDNAIFILGHVYNRNYQRTKWILEKIVRQRLSQVVKPPSACGLFESDFQQQLWNFQHAVGDVFWTCRTEVMVFINGAYIGDDESLRLYLNKNFTIPVTIPSLDAPVIQQEATREFLDFIEQDKRRKYVYLNIGIDSCHIGSLVICLYTDVCPVTCEMFTDYVRTSIDQKRDIGKPGYIGTKIHRIASPSFLQCGDIQECTPIFSDESFEILHDRRGVVSFSNIGPDTNKCQFIISLNPNPWMNRKYVAFGQVVEGMQVLDWIEKVPTFYESPQQDIEILECGTLPIATSKYDSTDDGVMKSQNILPSLPSMNAFELKSIPDESDILLDIKQMVMNELQDQPFPVKDNPHPEDTRSDHLLLERYLQGLYTMPREYQVYAHNLKKFFPNTTDGLDYPCEPNTALGETYCEPELDLQHGMEQMLKENLQNQSKMMDQIKSDLKVGFRQKLMDAIQNPTKENDQMSDLRLDIKLMVRDALRNQSKVSDHNVKSKMNTTGKFITPCEVNKIQSLTDHRQYYSLIQDNNILNPGLNEDQLRGKTDEEILLLFDDITICSDDTESDKPFPDFMSAVDSMDFFGLHREDKGDGIENSEEGSSNWK